MPDQDNTGTQLKQIAHFFNRKRAKYILLALEDQRMLEYIIVSIQVKLKKKNKDIRHLVLLNDEECSVYHQVKKFLADNACDGLIVTNLDSLIYQNSSRTIQLLNKSRDAFERFQIPFVFVVSTNNLKKIIKGAPDFYQLRELADFHFQGTGIFDYEFRPGDGRYQLDYASLVGKEDLLEEQLESYTKEGNPSLEVLNNIVVPLLQIYIYKSYYNKMKDLFKQYLQGKEDKIEDKNVLNNYYARMGEIKKTSLYPPKYRYGKPSTPPELRQRIIEKQSESNDFTPLFLDKSIGSLSPAQRLILEILSIYRNPVPKEAVEVQGAAPARIDIKRLAELSLLECIEIERGYLYYVHRLTAQYILNAMDMGVKNKYHLQAAQYFEEIRDEEGKSYVDNDIEACWHFIQAGEWNRAAEMAFEIEDYLTLLGFPQRSMELLQELEGKKLDDKNRAIVYHRMGNLYLGLGEYEAALTQYRKSLEIKEKIGDSKGVSASLHNIGIFYQNKGDYDAALTQYRKSLEIDEKNDDIQGEAKSLHQIGNIFYLKGEYEAALTQYRKSMEIKEKIGDIQGVSTSLLQIGMIYQEKGEYETALTQYRKSLEIKEKIGDTKGVSESLHGVGAIYQLKGEYEAALTQYRKSLEICEKIGDIKGVAKSLHSIGMIYQEKGDYDAALTQYQKSLEIKEKIGDIQGEAISKSQLGNLYFEQDQFEIALKYSIQGFIIFSRIGSPHAELAKSGIARCREKLPEERFNAILKEFGGNVDL
ncbi:MAG: hypothetical protein QG657_1884 [Acidobacteriota bacterium]|nr:hypothetical protein [Acidobacteriota bacterium]